MGDRTLAETSRIGDKVMVECLHSVLQEIGTAAQEHDVTGILLGTKDELRVRILAFRRLVPRRIFGRSATLSDGDRDAVARLIARPPAEGELYGLEPVGWFRAEPRRSLVLSDLELELLNTFFTEPGQVGMVLRAASFGPTRARFYVREPDGFAVQMYRELIVPAVAERPMLVVEGGGPQRERPAAAPGQVPLRERPAAAPGQVPPREFRGVDHVNDRIPDQLLPEQFQDQIPDYLRDRTEAMPAEPPRVAGWIWRAASSLAITVFVVGYWWISYSRQQAERQALKRAPDIVAEADRQQLPPALPDLAELRRPGAERSVDADIRTEPPIPDIETTRIPEKDLDTKIPERNADTSAPEKAQQRPNAAEKPAQSERAAPPSRSLRPLRLPALSRRSIKIAELAAPPQLAREGSPLPPLPLPQAITVVPPTKAVAPKSAVAAGPSSGSLIWTGRAAKNATLTIDGNRASFGALTGGLPGRPVQIHVYPGDLADDEILVFTADSQDARLGWDAAGPQDGWNRVVYEFNPRNARAVEVEEAPGPYNGWKRLVIRCNNPKISVIYVKWSAR
ncbi:MAG TPA: hypothetical protein VKT49_14820 [Bryobacteraceae bacterium]|nr:hypothetical protein [Bryobacteraceae bacterium]